MTGNEEKLRRVMFEEAAEVLPSADAWPRIRQGADRRRRWRMLMQYGGATAGATAAIVAGVMFTGSGERTPDDVATEPVTPSPSVATAKAITESASPLPSNSALPPVTSTAAPTSSPTSIATAPTSFPTAVPIPEGRLGDVFASVLREGDKVRIVLFAKAGGTAGVYLTEDTGIGGVSAPTASPDGKSIYYLRAGGVCESGVFRVPVSGGRPEKVIALQESVVAFALNGDGTKIAALRNAECNNGEGATILVEYDAATGAEIRQLDLPAVPSTVPTGVAWHPTQPELAVVRSGQDGEADRVSILPLPESSRSAIQPVVGFDSCIAGGITHMSFSGEELYIAQNCTNVENAAKYGRIYRIIASGDRENAVVAKAPDGEAIAGLHVEPDGRVVYSTVRWGEEALYGPTTLWRIEDRGVQLFEAPVPSLLLGLAW